MKRIILLIIAIVLIGNIPASAQKMRIAVIDLKPNNVPQTVSAAASNLIRADLVDTKMFIVVERDQMNQIFNEQSLQMTGCTDNACVVQIGKLLSANKILVGEISQIGKTVIITVRIVDVEKGVAEFSATERAKSMDNIDEAVNNLVKRLIDTIGGKRITDFAGVLEAPENISASDDDYTNKVIVKWSGVKQADKYYVFKAKSSKDKFELVYSTEGTSFEDKDLKPGETYYYKVRSGLYSRFSEFSNTVSGSTLNPVTQTYVRGIIPGLGQIYSGNDTKGKIFLSGFVLSTGFLGYSIYDYKKKKDEYNSVKPYSPPNEFNSKYDAYKKAANIAIFSVTLWAVIYVANWVDLLNFNEPRYSGDSGKQTGGYIDFKIFNGNEMNGKFERKVMLSVNYNF